MSNLAQEEADRMLLQRDRYTSHPEDRDESDTDSQDANHTTEPAFTSNHNDDADDDDDDLDISNRMSSLTTTTSSYTIPRGQQSANTGPKGVISDAQSFARAKQSANRKAVSSIVKNTFDSNHAQTPPAAASAKPKGKARLDSDSDSDPLDSEDDTFLTQWRATRLAELSSATSKPIAPRPRYGHVRPVDATGYLTTLETTAADTTVVVMLHDDRSPRSVAVSDELDALASSYDHVRFVRMDHAIAEMQHVRIPALLAYRGGELCGTVSDAKVEGLEGVLLKQGVL